MSDRADELLAKYLDGDIDEREADELLELVKKNPVTFHRLRQLMQLDERLRQEVAGDSEGELLARAVLERLRSSEHDTDFARRVVRQLPSRPAFTSRRTTLPGQPPARVWIAVSAAAVLVFFLVLVLANRPEARPQAALRRDLPKHTEPEPSPSFPTPEDLLRPSPEKPTPVLPPDPRGVPSPLPPRNEPEPARPPVAPIPEPRKREPDTTVVQAATPAVQFEEVEGEVFALVGTATIPARPGAALPAGAGVEAKGAASLLFLDGTRFELRAGTKVDEVIAGSAEEAKRIILRAGALTAVVAPQPANRPLTIQTPQGKVEVLGTFLRVGVEAGTTRVDVLDGHVQVSKNDGTSAAVRAGQGALVSPSTPISVQPLIPSKAGAPFASQWLAENRNPRWRAAVDGRAKALLISSADAEAETSASVWAMGAWNLVLGNLQGAMEIVTDAKTTDGEGKRHELILRIIEGRTLRPDQWIEIALTPAGNLEARENGKERTLGTASVRDLIKARRSLPVEFEVTQTTLRLTAGGRTIFAGPHLLGGFGIVRVSLTGVVHEAGGTSLDRILNPRLVYVPSPGK